MRLVPFASIVPLLAVTACHDGTKSSSDLAVSSDLHAPEADFARLDLSTLDFADASTPPDLSAPDLSMPDLACPLSFVGGGDVVAQGWSTEAAAPDTISVPSSGITQLATSTNSGALSGGQLLLYKSLVTPGQAFAVEVVAKVIAVNAHNQYDAAVAFMGSFHPPVGLAADRGEMIYIDAAKLGWADDSQSAAADALDGNFHTYRLAVDAAGNATVSRDGTQLLSRTGFTTNGTIAFGDQTNDANVDATTQVKSIQVLCGP